MEDLNCKLLSMECRESKSLNSIYELLNLMQLIPAPTRVTETLRSLLHVILALQTKQEFRAVKTTHGTQIVFGRRSGSASLKDQSAQKSTAKRTRSWWTL